MRAGVVLLVAVVVVPVAFAIGRYAGLSEELTRVQAVHRLHPFDPKTSLVVVTPGRVFGNVPSRDPAAQSTAGSVHSAVEVILL